MLSTQHPPAAFAISGLEYCVFVHIIEKENTCMVKTKLFTHQTCNVCEQRVQILHGCNCPCQAGNRLQLSGAFFQRRGPLLDAKFERVTEFCKFCIACRKLICICLRCKESILEAVDS